MGKDGESQETWEVSGLRVSDRNYGLKDGRRYWRAVTRTKPTKHVWSGWGVRESEDTICEIQRALEGDMDAQRLIASRSAPKPPRDTRVARNTARGIIDSLSGADLHRALAALSTIKANAFGSAP